MSFSIEFADEMQQYQARIKVLGVGGSGGNAINTMMQYGLQGVEFVAVNTDAQALNANTAPTKIAIGCNVTRGLGAGADPERGRKAAIEDVNRLKEAIAGADMIFITAGMGGGTGTGAAPIIAQLAREEGILTVGVVTRPFFFEGRQRCRRADAGISTLAEQVDTLITIPNEKLLTMSEDLSFVDAFRKADEVLYQAVQGISDLITQEGIVNVDFADVRAVMQDMGRSLMGSGCAKGEGRARLAAEQAVTSPLLDDISVQGATGVLINVVGGPDMKMSEVREAAALIQEQAHEDANIIFGAAIDENMTEMIKVTVIATGFDRTVDEQIKNHQGGVVSAAEERQIRENASNMHQSARHSASGMAPRTRSEMPPASVPAVSSRRSAPATVAKSYAPPAAPQVRDSISFPSSMTDDDWDVPAFQRRSS